MNKNRIVIAALFAILSFALYSCSKDNEEDLSKNIIADDCLAEKASYATIQPIFSTHCISCHSTSSFEKNVKLDTYEGVKDAVGKELLQAINHENGTTPMPYLKGKLDSCDIAKIESWINRNFPQ